MEQVKLSDYAKIFTLLLKRFEDVETAIAWLKDYGALFKDGDNIVNAFGLKVVSEDVLREVKIIIEGEEWNE
jgi:hypothetical protein